MSIPVVRMIDKTSEAYLRGLADGKAGVRGSASRGVNPFDWFTDEARARHYAAGYYAGCGIPEPSA